MLAQDDGLYFITARGKPYYKQLRESLKIGVCAMDRHYVNARITGDIRFCKSRDMVDKIFTHNPVLTELYPDEKKNILEAFHLYKGKGEIFDLSLRPPRRDRFAFGGATVNPPGYRINENCTACGLCRESCPVGVISEGDIFSVNGNSCLECGICAEICPENAVEQSLGM
jgi:uncharacterized pyridoxamine 5'-phosphate oxidase family protein